MHFFPSPAKCYSVYTVGLAADSHVEIRQLVAACLGGLARVYVHVSPQERLEPLMNAIICQAEGENRASHATMCNAVHLLLPQIDAVAARELLPLFISSFGSKLRSFDVESHLAAAKALCNLADTTGIAFCEHILALVKVMVSLAAGMVTPSMAAADANLSITEIRSGLHPDSRQVGSWRKLAGCRFSAKSFDPLSSFASSYDTLQALAELGTTMLRHMLTDWAEYFAEERVPHEAYSQLVNTLLVLLDSHVVSSKGNTCIVGLQRVASFLLCCVVVACCTCLTSCLPAQMESSLASPCTAVPFYRTTGAGTCPGVSASVSFCGTDLLVLPFRDMVSERSVIPCTGTLANPTRS